MKLIQTFFFLAFVTANFAFGQESLRDTTRQTEEEIMAEEKYVIAVNKRILGDYDEAIQLLEALIKKDPSNAAYFYELARNQNLNKQYTQAIVNSQSAMRLDRENVWYALFTAELHERNGQPGQAAEVYEQILVQHPRVEEYWIKLNRLYDEANLPEKSISVFDRMEQIFGPSEELLFRRFQSEMSQEHLPEAIKLMELLSNQNPRNIMYLTTLGNLYKNNGRAEEAKTIFEKVLTLDPNNSRANLALAEDLKKNNQDDQYLNAISSLLENKDIHVDAKITELIPYLQKYMETNDQDLENALFNASEKLIKTHPGDPKTEALSGDIHFYAADYDTALYHYNNALALTSKVYSIFDQKMLILLYQKKYEELSKFANSVIDLYPNQLSAFLNLAYSLLKLSDVESALQVLKEMELMSGKKGELAPRVAALQFIGYSALNDQKQAEKYFLRMDELTTTPDAAQHVGSLLADFKISSEYALEKLHLANDKKIEDPIRDAAIASLYADKKDYKMASQWIEKALGQGGEKFPFVVETAGDIYFLSKLPSKALEYWESAKKMGVVSKKLENKIASKQLIN